MRAQGRLLPCRYALNSLPCSSTDNASGIVAPLCPVQYSRALFLGVTHVDFRDGSVASISSDCAGQGVKLALGGTPEPDAGRRVPRDTPLAMSTFNGTLGYKYASALVGSSPRSELELESHSPGGTHCTANVARTAAKYGVASQIYTSEASTVRLVQGLAPYKVQCTL